LADFLNKFSWSLSRHNTFSYCLRRYYLNYYGYWGGWAVDADSELRLLYRLRNMTDTIMFTGIVVHEAIQNVIAGLQQGVFTQVDSSVNRAIEEFRSGWTESSSAAWIERPKQATNLMEHYYGYTLDDERKLALRNRITDSISGFFASEAYHVLKSLRPDDIIANDEAFASFVLNGITIYAQPDCAVRLQDRVRIYDWKTGRPDNHGLQLGIYQLYAMNTWSVSEDCIDAETVFLRERPVFVDATCMESEQARQFIDASIAAMQALLDDPVSNVADREQFPLTDDQTKCRRCPFREACHGDSLPLSE
jgi:hypothetical protein